MPAIEAKDSTAAHKLFSIVVALKGLMGVFELVSGSALSLLGNGTILSWIDWATQGELVADPHDWLATLLRHWAESFNHDAQMFAGVYLLAHGVVKIVLAVSLLLERKWAFPGFGLVRPPCSVFPATSCASLVVVPRWLHCV